MYHYYTCIVSKNEIWVSHAVVVHSFGSHMNLRRGKVSVVMVHSSLDQRLIRHGWEASLPDVGLSKFLRTKAQRHFQIGQYLIKGWDESHPTITMKTIKFMINFWSKVEYLWRILIIYIFFIPCKRWII